VRESIGNHLKSGTHGFNISQVARTWWTMLEIDMNTFKEPLTFNSLKWNKK